MADFGLQGFPARPDGVDLMTRYRTVLEMAPPVFSTVWISDHLQFGADPTVDGWTVLAYLAASFPRFRYGHLVLSQSFRNPALLAKMAATLQLLSGGRFILGLGAGWHEEEYRAYGYEYPSRGTRVAQLAEAIEVIRAMWTQSPATYHGTYYHIDGDDGRFLMVSSTFLTARSRQLFWSQSRHEADRSQGGQAIGLSPGAWT